MIPIDDDAIGTVVIIIITDTYWFIVVISMDVTCSSGQDLHPSAQTDLVYYTNHCKQLPGSTKERLFDYYDQSIRKYAWVISMSISIGMPLAHDGPTIIIKSLHLGQYILLFFGDLFIRFQLFQCLLDLYVHGVFVSVLFVAAENNCCIHRSVVLNLLVIHP